MSNLLAKIDNELTNSLCLPLLKTAKALKSRMNLMIFTENVDYIIEKGFIYKYEGRLLQISSKETKEEFIQEHIQKRNRAFV